MTSKSKFLVAMMASSSAAVQKAATPVAPMSYQFTWKDKIAKYKSELAKGVWGYWKLGAWTPLALSARKRAAIRREALLAGEDWPYDPPKKEQRTKRKGHKCDRVSAEKRARTAELMQKMPEMLLAYKVSKCIGYQLPFILSCNFIKKEDESFAMMNGKQKIIVHFSINIVNGKLLTREY
ncbi:hypothetical protein KSP39_PZI014799 [Platanthera zijinensis]|uniref:Uncharacterized protein n=1 Tax=Platanthera zijinensis TaxID=2320716 RepID=A0AAP0BAJ8_9ASPA